MVGRMLRTLRLASSLTVADAALSAELPQQRRRDLEAGRSALGFDEGLLLAKAYQLCTTCFIKHYRSAAARDGRPEGDIE